MFRLTLGIALLLVVTIFVACSSSPAPGSASTGGTASSTELALGQQLFTANCAACHGAMGQGQPNWHIPKPDGILPAPPLNGDGHTWHHGDGFLYRVVSEGGQFQETPTVPSFKSGMPAFGTILSDDEIVAVLGYVKSLWADKTRGGFSIRESQALRSETDPLPIAVE